MLLSLRAFKTPLDLFWGSLMPGLFYSFFSQFRTPLRCQFDDQKINIPSTSWWKILKSRLIDFFFQRPFFNQKHLLKKKSSHGFRPLVFFFWSQCAIVGSDCHEKSLTTSSASWSRRERRNGTGSCVFGLAFWEKMVSSFGRDSLTQTLNVWYIYLHLVHFSW